MASLVNQLQYALKQRFKPGASKHAAEHEHRQITVYSYDYRDNLNDFARNFGHYVKEHHPDIKYVKDIDTKHVDEYLTAKIEAGCSVNYIDNLRSSASKMGHIASSVYGCSTNWQSTVELSRTPQNASNRYDNLNMLTPEQWDTLKEDIQDSQAQSALAVKVAGAFGLRVSELTKLTPKDIQEDGILHIHRSKGGRSRDLEVRTEEQKEAIELLHQKAEGLEPLQKLITVKPDSINKYYREHAEKIGVEDAELYGVHQLRRMVATNYYHELIEQGIEEKDAENKVSNWLGHGNNRPDIIKKYVQK